MRVDAQATIDFFKKKPRGQYVMYDTRMDRLFLVLVGKETLSFPGCKTFNRKEITILTDEDGAELPMAGRVILRCMAGQGGRLEYLGKL
jgi:hypothetical protein